MSSDLPSAPFTHQSGELDSAQLTERANGAFNTAPACVFVFCADMLGPLRLCVFYQVDTDVK